MAFPYIPVGISAGVLGLMLWSRTASAATSAAGSDKGPEKRPPGGGPIPVNPGRFPEGSAVGIVVVKPTDPGLQGRQAGVRINNQPKPRADGAGQAAPGTTGDEIPSGERVLVLSGEIADSHGRKWRQVRTLTNVTGYAAFVDPDGVTQNIVKAPESAPWPGEGPSGEVPIAGRPARFDRSARIGACGPQAYPAYPYGLGWAPWGAGWAGTVPQFDIVGQGAGRRYAQCVRPCPVYEQPGGRGYPWTVTSSIPANATVEIAGAAGGPGAGYVYIRHGDRAGWTSAANLRSYAPRTLGKRRLPLPPPVLR